MSSVRTDDNTTFINELSRTVGHSHLLTDPAKTARYRKGFRSGEGDALAVVFPVRCSNCGACSAPALRQTRLF